MSRKPIIAGNWKMNLNHVEAVNLVQQLGWALADKGYDTDKVECVVIPPFTDLRTVQTLIDSDKLPIKFGAQDVSEHESGAYTGEISASMLAKLNASYVVVGHSERREYHDETDKVVNAKARAALDHGIAPIVCVGEGLEVRKAGNQVSYTLDQVKNSLDQISAEQMTKVVIAYEPVWAIGTGEVATPDDAQEVCGAIRQQLADLYDQGVAEAVRIQYGGSVKPESAAALMAMPDVDGALVGGASLKAQDFADIVTYYDRTL